MFDSTQRFLDRLLAPLPAHLFIISGMTLLGLAMVMPAWLESRELAWRVSLMKVQAERLSEQAKGYREFNDALAADDPVLLERLAFYHLRLKPAGSEPLMAAFPASTTARTPTAAATPSIEQMLHRPLPDPGNTTTPYQPPRTRLVLLTTGPMRMGVILAGALCLLAGLTSPVIVGGRKPEDEPEPSTRIDLPNLGRPTADVTTAAPVIATAPTPSTQATQPLVSSTVAPTLKQRAAELREKLRLRLGRWGA